MGNIVFATSSSSQSEQPHEPRLPNIQETCKLETTAAAQDANTEHTTTLLTNPLTTMNNKTMTNNDASLSRKTQCNDIHVQ